MLIRATPFCRRRLYHHAPLEGQRTSEGTREQQGSKKKSPNPLVKKINDPKSHQSVLAVLGSGRGPGEELINPWKTRCINQERIDRAIPIREGGSTAADS